MATTTPTLSIGCTFRNAEEIKEVEQLHKEILGTTYTKSDIYLAGLRRIVGMIKKAQGLVR